MAWDTSNDPGSTKDKVFVREGNIDWFLFTEKATTVRFLTEDITAEDIMSARNVPREQAVEILKTEVLREKWVQPMSYWEHSVPSIPGARFFSTVPCVGNRNGCNQCAANQEKKDAGISENKLLPFPIRKRFYAPAYFYELGRVLFVRGNEDFFNDLAVYINKHGSAISFDIWKTGKGFETKYKSTFNGPAEPIDPEFLTGFPTPNQADFYLDAKEVESRVAISGGSRTQQSAAVPAASPPPAAASSENPADFVIPFGSHKGKTLGEIHLIDANYAPFLVKNGSGQVKEVAQKFVEGLPK